MPASGHSRVESLLRRAVIELGLPLEAMNVYLENKAKKLSPRDYDESNVLLLAILDPKTSAY